MRRTCTGQRSLPQANVPTCNRPALALSGNPPGSARRAATGPGTQTAAHALQRMDADKDGALERGELFAAVQRMGLRLTPAQLGALMDRFDANGNGRIDISEFTRVLDQMHAARTPQPARSHRRAGRAHADDADALSRELGRSRAQAAARAAEVERLSAALSRAQASQTADADLRARAQRAEDEAAALGSDLEAERARCTVLAAEAEEARAAAARADAERNEAAAEATKQRSKAKADAAKAEAARRAQDAAAKAEAEARRAADAAAAELRATAKRLQACERALSEAKLEGTRSASAGLAAPIRSCGVTRSRPAGASKRRRAREQRTRAGMGVWV